MTEVRVVHRFQSVKEATEKLTLIASELFGLWEFC